MWKCGMWENIRNNEDNKWKDKNIKKKIIHVREIWAKEKDSTHNKGQRQCPKNWSNCSIMPISHEFIYDLLYHTHILLTDVWPALPCLYPLNVRMICSTIPMYKLYSTDSALILCTTYIKGRLDCDSRRVFYATLEATQTRRIDLWVFTLLLSESRLFCVFLFLNDGHLTACSPLDRCVQQLAKGFEYGYIACVLL